jgi:hypothetical protein
MTIRRLAAIAMICGLLTAYHTPSEALEITWDFASAYSSTFGSNYTTGYTFVSGGVTVTVTGWAAINGTFQQAAVARNNGLGGCNSGDGAANCTGDLQRLDNIGQLDFILFQFNTPVDLKAITFDPGTSTSTLDRDVSYWSGNLTGSLAGQLLPQSTLDLSGVGFGSVTNVSNSACAANSATGCPLTLSLTGTSVTALLFGTYAGTSTGNFTAGDDRFYVRSLTDDYAAVPEPGTLFLLGSGLVGVAAFRRRHQKRG